MSNVLFRVVRFAGFALLVVVTTIGCPWPAQAIPIAHLTLESQAGDFIGQGGTFDITYTSTNSDSFFPQVRRSIGPFPGAPSELLFVLGTVTSGQDNTFALLFFGTDQLGIPIQPGFYPNAERADFASPGYPGLDVSFQNRGCNTVTGSFTIDHVTFSGPSTIQTFGATFEQHCEGIEPALFGSFAFDASPTIPSPGTWMLLSSGISLLVLLLRRSSLVAPAGRRQRSEVEPEDCVRDCFGVSLQR